jgi:hypothetical protein
MRNQPLSAKIVGAFSFNNISKVFMIITSPLKEVVTIRKLNILPIALLLTFISFSTFHHSNEGLTHPHHANKAVLTIDDWNSNPQSDDEEKHLFNLNVAGVLVLISLIVVILHKTFSRMHNKNFIFLIPVFHQSNYVIYFPELLS